MLVVWRVTRAMVRVVVGIVIGRVVRIVVVVRVVAAVRRSRLVAFLERFRFGEKLAHSAGCSSANAH